MLNNGKWILSFRLRGVFMSRIFSGLFGLTIIGFLLTFMKMRKMSSSGFKPQKQDKDNKKDAVKETVNAV